MSRNAKSLLIILGVAAIFCIAAVAFAVAGAGLVANRLKDSFVMDHAKVQEMAREIINYELPAGYSEQLAMNLAGYKMIFIGASESLNSKPMIVVADFQVEGLSSDEMSRQMQQSIEQQSGNNGLKLKVVETRNVTINGQDVPLTISEGTNSTGEPFRQWVTTFPGKVGTVLIMIQGRVSDWDDSLFETFLASIST